MAMLSSQRQLVADDVGFAVAELDLKGRWLDANERLCTLLGYSFEQLSRIPFDRVFVPQNHDAETNALSRVASGAAQYHSSERSAKSAGGTIPVRITFSRSEAGRLFACAEDLTTLRQAEAALRESETARHELARRLTNAQEEERTRIARELHDDIGQSLAILRIQMLRAGQPVSGVLGKRHPTVPELCDSLKAITERVSCLSHQLHSSELEYLGLAAAVQSHCREFSEKYKIPVECSCEEIPEHLESFLALSLLRIVQEALHNAGKHSQAKSIQVALHGSPGELSLLIADDGVGFSLEEAKLAAGLGLISMRERVHLAAGQFEITSTPGEGTCINARIPVPDDHVDTSSASATPIAMRTSAKDH